MLCFIEETIRSFIVVICVLFVILLSFFLSFSLHFPPLCSCRHVFSSVALEFGRTKSFFFFLFMFMFIFSFLLRCFRTPARYTAFFNSRRPLFYSARSMRYLGCVIPQGDYMLKLPQKHKRTFLLFLLFKIKINFSVFTAVGRNSDNGVGWKRP